MIYRFLNLFAFGTAPRPDQPILPQHNLITNKNNDYSVDIKTIQIETTEESDETATSRIANFLLCFAGLQMSFLIWGLMQERIIKFGYSESISEFESQDEISAHKKQFSNFKNSQFLVLSNRFAGLLVSLLILFVCNRKTFKFNGIKFSPSSLQKIVSCKNWAPLFICSYASLSNVLSSWFQYESLKYVSFTTQLLAKSSKSVFIMLTGKVISNKHYKLHEYICVFIIGCGIFLFSDINKTRLDETNKIIKTTFPGLVCLLGYLISDSFTSTWQDNLIKNYSMSSISLMFITNLYSCLYTFISLWSQDQLKESIKFMFQHSDITGHIVLLSIASAIGQIFIFITIQKFGALVFSLMMTTRQILSIFLSSIVFQHSMSVQSLFGISLIFFALFLQQYLKFHSKKEKNRRFLKSLTTNIIF